MTQEFSEGEAVKQVVTYLALLLQYRCDGHAVISIEELEEGLPKGHGVHMEQDTDGNLTMSIRSNDEH